MSAEWKVNGSTDSTAIWVEDADGKRVCTVRNCENDLDRARLLAASPKLLAALQLCVVRDPSLKNNVTVTAAIAEAEGTA